MIRKSVLAATIAALLTPAVAHALGLGNIEVSSELNEPLQARIPLRGVAAGDMESLRVGIGSDEQFARAGLERVFILTKLRFEVVETSAGSGFIRVTSRDPIAEPFLNFLVDVNWPRGRVLREYTVLLDPPVYGAAINSARKRAAQSAAAVTEGSGRAPPARTGAAVRSAPAASAVSAARVSGAPRYGADSYGPVRAGETLWSIADRVRPGGVSIQNMMLALLRANPEAFSIDNVNALRTGAVLRIPSASEIADDQAQALATVARQHALWEEYRQSLPAMVGTQPGGTAVPAVAPPAAVPPAAPPAAPAGAPASGAGTATGGQPPATELKVVGGSTAGSGSAAVGDVQTLRNELTLAQEEAEAAKRENEELSSRLGEVETLVGDLRRLVELKEDQLAALQQQLSQMPPASTAAPAPAGEAPAPASEAPAPAGEAPVPAAESPAPAGEAPAPTSEAPAPASEVPAPAAETPPAAEQPAPAQPAAPDSRSAAAPEQPARPVSMPPPPPPMSFMDQLNAMLPVPLWTVLAALGALLLLGFGGSRWARARRERRAEAAAVAVAGAPALAEDESMMDQYARTELPADGDADVTELPDVDAAHGATAIDEYEVPAAADRTEISRGDTGHAYAGPGVDDDDPLAEVNVYLAYERFDQAEQLVRDAISRYPQHHEYKLKLLEVFYAAKNVAGFEAAARDLRAAVGDEHELMQQARAWWQDLGTGRELFEEDDTSAVQSTQAGLLATQTGLLATQAGVSADDDLFDVTSADSGDETGVDFDLGFDSEEGAAAASSLDFDLGADDRPAGESADAELDFDLGGFDTDDGTGEGRAPAETAVDFDLGADADAPASDSADTGLDFDLDGLDAEPARAGTGTAELPDRNAAAGDTGLDFDVFEVASDSDEPRTAAAGQDDESSLDFTLDDGRAAAHAAAPASDEDGTDSGLDFDLSDTTSFHSADVAGEPDAGTDAERSADRSGATTLGGTRSDDDASGGDLDFDLGDDAAAPPRDEPKRAHAAEADPDPDLELFSGDSAADDSARSLDLDLSDDDTAGSFQDAHTQISDGSELDLTLDEDDPRLGARSADEVDFPLLDTGDDERPPGAIETVQLSPQDSDSLREQSGVHGDDDDEREFAIDTEFRDIFAAGGSDSDSGSRSTSVLDFDLGTDLGDEQSDGDDDESTQFMLRDLPGDGDDEDSDDHTLALGRGGAGEVDEMQTKLDLAQAYMDMGDSEGARNLLGEVMAEGGDAQKDQAREMLTRL